MTLESADREELLSRLRQARPASKRGPNAPISYNGAHRRIYRARGSAAAHLCECGSSAETWAYDHDDPEELTEIIGGGWTAKGMEVAYSANPLHYIPMCRACHTAFDMRVAGESAAWRGSDHVRRSVTLPA